MKSYKMNPQRKHLYEELRKFSDSGIVILLDGIPVTPMCAATKILKRNSGITYMGDLNECHLLKEIRFFSVSNQ